MQIVEKKGDVVVWGPAGGRGKQGARLPRIICYGDSNTAGYHSGGRKFQPYGQSLASELADMGMPCEVAVCGLCVFTTQDMLNERTSDRIKAQVGPHGRGLIRMLDEDGPVDLVILMTGTNDLGFQTPCAIIVQHMAQLHSICHQRGVSTVAIAATQISDRPCRKLRQQLADSVAKWAMSVSGVIDCLDVEDLCPRSCGKDGTSSIPGAAANWEPDDLHLSATGSIALGRRLASHALTWLQRLTPDGTDAVKLAARTKVCSPSTSPGCSVSVQPAGRSPLTTRGLNHSEKTIAITPTVPTSPLQALRFTGACGLAFANGQRRHQHHAQRSHFATAVYGGA